jgi:hypothetical protein
MEKVNVTKPFILNKGGVLIPIGLGVQEIDSDESNHWYVLSHSEPVAELEIPRKLSRQEEIAKAMAEFDAELNAENDEPSPGKKGKPKKDK